MGPGALAPRLGASAPPDSLVTPGAMPRPLLSVGLLSVLAGCAPPPDLPVHHLVMGGDVMLGRAINVALADPEKSPDILAAISQTMRSGDITLVNGEGVIALGGTYSDKGEPRPHQHHALPEAVAMLQSAGVDVVTMGNNHAGDYGPAALIEARDRLLMAGIDISGAGQDLAEARTPVYRRVGDVVVAIIGADLTVAGRHAATANRAGILHFEGMEPKQQDAVVKGLLGIEAEARRHAQIVVLSPHWGENFLTAPTDLTRAIAHALIDGGYDAILGHSAHVMQGVELYHGSPIAYDAGDLVNDYPAADEAQRAVLYDLAFTRAGAVSLEAHPLFLATDKTTPASGKVASTVLDNWVARSEALGTTVSVVNGVGHLDCRPGGIEGPAEVVDPPARPTPTSVRLAPSETVLDALPATAHPAVVEWPDLGLHLIGYELMLDELKIPKAGNIVRLYFRADKPLPVELRVRIGTTDNSPDAIDDHVPGDWLLPGDRWPTGVIVQDRYLTRMLGKPEGVVTYRAGVVMQNKVVPPATADLPVVDGLLEIGKATWSEGAPGMFTVFAADPRSQLGQ